jgi:hypothetical protein
MRVEHMCISDSFDGESVLTLFALCCTTYVQASFTYSESLCAYFAAYGDELHVRSVAIGDGEHINGDDCHQEQSKGHHLSACESRYNTFVQQVRSDFMHSQLTPVSHMAAFTK